MSLIDLRTTRVLFTVLVFGLALGFLYVAHRTLIAFLFAVFFAYLMDPAVSRVEKWTHGRGRAIALIYALLVILLATFFFFVGPQIGRQGQRLSKALLTLPERVSSGQIAQDIGAEHGWSQDSRRMLQEFLVDHKDSVVPIAQQAGLRLAEAAQESWLLIVVPILAAFFLKDGRAFSDVLLSIVNARAQREFLEGVLGDLNQMLAQFIRAQLTLAAMSLVVYTAFMGSMKMPYALVLGTAGGMLEFIPVVGPLVAALLILGVALLLELSPLAVALDVSVRLANDPGLRGFPSHHGKEHGIASAGSDFWGAGGWRNCGRARRLPFDSGHGQPAHRVAALAPVCREKEVWTAQRVFVRDRDRTQKIEFAGVVAITILPLPPFFPRSRFAEIPRQLPATPC